ncbi:MAG: hypothetical protein LIV29_08470, partial [Denitrobacterium sp.]|nr:hypothetical protein [Denitrobacterium sp.]
MRKTPTKDSRHTAQHRHLHPKRRASVEDFVAAAVPKMHEFYHICPNAHVFPVHLIERHRARTQRVEAELVRLIDEFGDVTADVVRMDADTTSRKGA